jgi:hypothetical protein
MSTQKGQLVSVSRGVIMGVAECKRLPPLDANEIVSTQPMTRDP